MDKSLELYLEENREQAIELKKSIDSLVGIFSGKIDVGFVPTEKVKIDGEVTVNTQDTVEVSNITDVVEGLKDLSTKLEQTIKDNAHKPVDTVTVANIKEAKTEEVTIKNWGDLKEFIEGISKAVEANQPILNITKQEVVFPTDPRKPMAVRLSDGKGWINQLIQGVASGVAETDPLVGYQPCDIDEAGTPKYYGFAKNNGSWYIMRESSGAYRYTKGAPQFNGGGLYADAWADKANLSYGYIFEVFK